MTDWYFLNGIPSLFFDWTIAVFVSLNCELIKISHHGSKANTNNTLLDLVDTDTYVISANGKHHNLPNKKCLARIINKKTSTVLLFNYPELIKQIFSEDEYNNGSFIAKGVDNLEFN